mmetsp:Transcript_47254/g.70000  ORF Transcript_47254/g.70000 Transcript_47254/m.70000 type:complete len:294 (-) Transcript_47254:657-1538(-)
MEDHVKLKNRVKNAIERDQNNGAYFAYLDVLVGTSSASSSNPIALSSDAANTDIFSMRNIIIGVAGIIVVLSTLGSMILFCRCSRSAKENKKEEQKLTTPPCSPAMFPDSSPKNVDTTHGKMHSSITKPDGDEKGKRASLLAVKKNLYCVKGGHETIQPESGKSMQSSKKTTEIKESEVPKNDNGTSILCTDLLPNKDEKVARETKAADPRLGIVPSYWNRWSTRLDARSNQESANSPPRNITVSTEKTEQNNKQTKTVEEGGNCPNSDEKKTMKMCNVLNQTAITHQTHHLH